MKIFKSIREFFWPLFDKDDKPKPPKDLSEDEIIVDEEHLSKTLEYAINSFNAQEDRRKTIEGKSSLFIGTISIVISVVIGISSSLTKTQDSTVFSYVLFFLLFLLTIYLIRTIWFSIKVLERAPYHVLSVKVFNITNESYYKKVITKIVNYTQSNSFVIDRKVDNMVMAQEYFKRAVVTIALCAINLLLGFLINQTLDIQGMVKFYIKTLNSIYLTNWNIIIIYSLLVLSITLSLISIFRKKRKYVC